MSGAFKITVTKEDLVFAAAHFITLPGHRCEALHGHNYRVGAAVEGGLEPETWFVLDFIALKRLLKQLTEELDHRVLLPAHSPKLAITERGDALAVAYDGRDRGRPARARHRDRDRGELRTVGELSRSV